MPWPFVSRFQNSDMSAIAIQAQRLNLAADVQHNIAEPRLCVMEQCHILVKPLACTTPWAMCYLSVSKAAFTERPRRFEFRDGDLFGARCDSL